MVCTRLTSVTTVQTLSDGRASSWSPGSSWTSRQGRRRLTGIRGRCLPRRRLQAIPEPLNAPGSLACTFAGAGCGDKALHWKSYTKLIQVAFDSNWPAANLKVSWSALRAKSWGEQTLQVPVFGSMKSSASGGRLDASGTTLYPSRTRQGVSVISKERPYWLTQQSQHEMKERSLL